MAAGPGRALRPGLLALSALALAAGAGDAAARPAAGRVMAPTAVACDANQLTSYFGKVTGYRRGASGTWLRIATDYDTVEEVQVPNGGAKDPSAHYLYAGRAFTAKDWTRIESKRGVLRAGTRATAWVCSDGRTPPLVDWNGAAE